MFTPISLIIWSLVALGIGFAAGYLVGLFRWKKSPQKAEVNQQPFVTDGTMQSSVFRLR
ncbi:hypothetical protein [Kosakonia sp. S42]|uniref:hypothetical protein n=1 Tax=Kosakonia sp. S42 TaxID=2767458 RepID=UPI001F2CB09A|nr:hypothetical protein [Kosakonia sp. S42]